jgi:hypothetical protein
MHFREEKDAEKLKKMVGDNPLASEIERKDNHEKYEMFEAIDVLVSGARKLYMDEELSWKEMCESLSDAVTKLAAKEKPLKAMVPKKEEGVMPELS